MRMTFHVLEMIIAYLFIFTMEQSARVMIDGKFLVEGMMQHTPLYVGDNGYGILVKDVALNCHFYFKPKTERTKAMFGCRLQVNDDVRAQGNTNMYVKLYIYCR